MPFSRLTRVLLSIATALSPLNASAATTSGPVTVDFAAVEYFPNLKSKIGLASNAKREELAEVGRWMDELGPGLMCGNIEFDLNFKIKEEVTPALSQRGGKLMAEPAQWFFDFQDLVGGLNIAQLYQLTGAPLQFQPKRMVFPSVHPPPTDPQKAADLIGAWTGAAATSGWPVYWSMWNEPGHTFMGIKRGQTLDGAKIGKESPRSFDRRDAAQRVENARTFTGLYALYDAAVRPGMLPQSRFGGVSFLDADFSPSKVSANGIGYFAEIWTGLARGFPQAKVDFLTFNSFNGQFSIILNGARAMTGTAALPIILTQYAPRNMKHNEDGTTTNDAGTTASPVAVSIEMLADLRQMERAPDLQHACLAYWIGGRYALLGRKRGLEPTARYAALKFFTDLPILRTRIDANGAGLGAAGVGGLAGVNAGRAAVLFWNAGSQTVRMPLTLSNLPPALQGARMRVQTLTGDEAVPEVSTFDGGELVLPSESIVMLDVSAKGLPDPLARRQSLGDGVRYLSTEIFPDLVSSPCAKGFSLPGAKGCRVPSGTYGAYDSVRSVAHLGQGSGGAEPRVAVSYAGLPDRIELTGQVIGTGQLDLVAEFAGCGGTAAARLANGTATLDLSGVAASCRAEGGRLEIRLSGAGAGAQAELYLSADPAEAAALAASAPPLAAASDLSTVEGLVVEALE